VLVDSDLWWWLKRLRGKEDLCEGSVEVDVTELVSSNANGAFSCYSRTVLKAGRMYLGTSSLNFHSP